MTTIIRADIMRLTTPPLLNIAGFATGEQSDSFNATRLFPRWYAYLLGDAEEPEDRLSAPRRQTRRQQQGLIC